MLSIESQKYKAICYDNKLKKIRITQEYSFRVV